MAKVVVLGTAHQHIFGMVNDARRSKNLEVVGVYDDDAQRRNAAAEKMGVSAFNTLEEALATKPNLALTTALPGTRAMIAEKCCAAGVPILVDKPLVLTHQALDHLIEIQKRHGTSVMVYLPYRGDPDLLAAKALLDSGK